MEKKSFQKLHHQLSWNTKIYTLLAISVAFFAKFSNALQSDFALTIILALLVILFVESFVMISVAHPNKWRVAKWIALLVALAILLSGTVFG
ncbi:MAG: hypothetical protein HKN87_12190 [Saprospiraceae bacterium]|nr:hypothetical protein [Saprospiraceae bacterium]